MKYVNCIMWLALCVELVAYVPLQIALGGDYGNWCMSEFLINYQAGFVRRGLLGELLYQFCSLTGINPQWIIFSLCLFTFLFVLSFFIRMFHRHNLHWWLLATMYVFGAANCCFLRKDFIVLSSFIGMLYLYRKTSLSSSIRLALVTIICVFLTLLYEPAFFMFMPFVGLLAWRDLGLTVPKWQRVASILSVCGVMALLILVTGSPDKAQTIQQSWHTLFPDVISSTPGSSVAAIDWDVAYSLQFNESILYCVNDARQGIGSIIFRLLTVTMVPYILIRYVYVLDKGEKPLFPCNYKVWGTLVAFQTLSLTPMWLGLSCDYGRMCMYVVLTSLSIVFILPPETVDAVFPQWATETVGKLNKSIDDMIPCSRSVMCMLLLCFGVQTYRFDLLGMFTNSPLGRIAVAARRAIPVEGSLSDAIKERLYQVRLIEKDDK